MMSFKTATGAALGVVALGAAVFLGVFTSIVVDFELESDAEVFCGAPPGVWPIAITGVAGFVAALASLVVSLGWSDGRASTRTLLTVNGAWVLLLLLWLLVGALDLASCALGV